MKGEPAGHRLLVKVAKIEETDEAYKKAASIGFDLSGTKEYQREQHGSTRATVLQIGHSAWRAYDSNWDQWKPWCKVGDDILFGRFSGKTVLDPDTQEKLLVINDDDVIYVFGDKDE